jgi:MtN3 and saliva related transmembrane protein
MDFINLLGLLAGTITSISFLPQLIKTWRSKSAKDVSLVMFLFLGIGITLWIVYGFLTNTVPIIAANVATLILIILIIGLKFKYK